MANAAMTVTTVGEYAGSYRAALKSSTVIAGSSAVAVLFTVFRAKALALLLGPSGVALFAVYGSVVLMISTLVGMGISTSGVRQVAEASASEDSRRLASTVKVLRLSAFVLGMLGTCLLCLFSAPLSRLTFSGSGQYAGALALLSTCVLLASVAQGQQALLQGKRMIVEIAVARIVAAALGAVVTIAIVAIFGDRGIVAAMIAASIATVIPTWWYARRVRLPNVSVNLRDLTAEAPPLLRLGFVFMISSFMLNGSMFLQRAIVIRQLGLDNAGYFQAAYALSVVYVGFILSAMSADFLPRLTGVANDDDACNRMVNEQTEVSLLLATPGILATFAMAPIVIPLFYSADFMPAVEVLRWQIVGVFGQVLTWPMGFIMVAKGRTSIVFFTNLGYAVIHLLLFWLAIGFFGLPGTGIAFGILHVYQYFVLTKVSKDVSGFAWSKANKRVALLAGCALLAIALSTRFLPSPMSTIVGCAISLLAAYLSLSKLSMLAGASSIMDLLARVVKKYSGLPRNGEDTVT